MIATLRRIAGATLAAVATHNTRRARVRILLIAIVLATASTLRIMSAAFAVELPPVVHPDLVWEGRHYTVDATTGAGVVAQMSERAAPAAGVAPQDMDRWDYTPQAFTHWGGLDVANLRKLFVGTSCYWVHDGLVLDTRLTLPQWKPAGPVSNDMKMGWGITAGMLYFDEMDHVRVVEEFYAEMREEINGVDCSVDFEALVVGHYNEMVAEQLHIDATEHGHLDYPDYPELSQGH